MLNGETERLGVVVIACWDCFQIIQKRATVEPWRSGTADHHVIAIQRADREKANLAKPEIADELLELHLNRIEDVLAKLNQIHLVYRNNDARNTQQRRDERMPARLWQHTFASVNQDDRQARRRCAGRHVPRILFMAWRVGDDELTAWSGEIAVRDVDGNSLLPLCAQAVRQQRQINAA